MSVMKELEVFQDLALRGPESGRSALRQALIDNAIAPWRHAEDEEEDLAAHAGGEADVVVFQRDAGDELHAAGLVLWSRSGGYEVTNIVPREVRELGHAGYNALLQDFIDRVATPAAKQAGFSIETTSPQQSLSDWLPPAAVDALRRFSATANKATGSSHPLDRTRWFAFLLSVHGATPPLDADRLARWLVEVEGWSDDKAHDLVVEYEFGLALLDEYDRNRS
ncbi:hypothetical protein [Methylorubrum thiocyanatum]|uniref:hypothetical protein n=1 Tax=Methylorubrum thiocyanatum TaxID=47958 RepID=UPI0035C79EA0